MRFTEVSLDLLSYLAFGEDLRTPIRAHRRSPKEDLAYEVLSLAYRVLYPKCTFYVEGGPLENFQTFARPSRPGTLNSMVAIERGMFPGVHHPT
jgi:hypothetical protein